MPSKQRWLTTLAYAISLLTTYSILWSQDSRYEIDTILSVSVDQRVLAFHSSNDTLYYTIKVEGDTTGAFELHASYDRGDSWDYVTTMHGRVSRSSSDATISVMQTLDEDTYRFVTIKGHEILHDTILDRFSFLNSYSPMRLFFHPNDANVMFLRIDKEGRRYRVYDLFFSIDRGKSWRHLDVPDPKVGWGNITEYIHDYQNPTNWRFRVQSDDSDGSTEYYVTGDSGMTFTETRPVQEPMFNFIQDNTHLRSLTGSTIDSAPWLTTPQDSIVQMLSWCGRMRSQLAYDTNAYLIPNAADFGSVEKPISSTFINSSSKDVVVYTLNLTDRNTGNSIQTPVGIAATTNFGISWEWLVGPTPRRLVHTIRYDHNTKYFYALVDDSDAAYEHSQFHLLRIRDAKLTANEEEVQSREAVYPNPCNSSLAVRLTSDFTENTFFRFYNIDGQAIPSIAKHFSTDADGLLFTLPTDHLANGLYLLSCCSGFNVITFHVTVLHL